MTCDFASPEGTPPASKLGPQSPRPGARVLRAAVLALVLLPAAACFEHPIDEELEIRFLPGGGVVVSASVSIRSVDDETPAVAERIADARRDLERGEDYWSRELVSVRPVAERLVQDRVDGALSHAARRIYLKDPDALRSILSRSSGAVRLARGEGWEEIRLAPLAGARASETQMRRSAEMLEDWSMRIARYLERVRGLYRYLDGRPDRAEICLAPLFEGAPKKRDDLDRPEPTEDEKTLIAPVSEAMSDLLEMFQAKEGAAWSPDEIVHIANDPFPSRLVVRVPSKVLESDGFVVEREGRLAVPEGGLFGAVTSLEGVWIAPDPLVALVRNGRRNPPEAFDIAAFAAAPRTARGGAGEGAVRRALLQALAPASVYRVRWAAPAPPVQDEIPDVPDWDSLGPP